MATKLQRKLACAILNGHPRPAQALFLAGMQSFEGARHMCRVAISAHQPSRRTGIGVRCRLRRGARCVFWLRQPAPKSTERLFFDLGTLFEALPKGRRPSGWAPLSQPSDAARWLAERCGGHEPTILRVCAAIERARQKCFEIAEEHTRWQ